jgi:predicted permease
VQVALCVVLLQASFLAVRGLQRASMASLGWNPRGIAMAATELGLARYTTEQTDSYHRRILDEARRLPGVESAATANSMPLHLDQSSTTVFPFPAREPDSGEAASVYRVSPGFFATLEIPLRSGRDFNDFDVASSVAVAVVNRTLAERVFGSTDAVGRQLREGRGGKPVEIIGVVEDGKYTAVAEHPRAAIFRPQSQQFSTSSMIIVRTSPPGSVRPEDLRRLIHVIDAGLPIRSSATGDELTALPLLPYRVAVAALGLLGLISSGLLLSGLHAMVAYAVARRQREIGIRVALGASRASVVRAMMLRVLGVVGIGVSAGIVLASGSGPLVSSMVLDVSPKEPALVAAIAIGLGVIVVASCAGPVRRSLRVDPLVALREE